MPNIQKAIFISSSQTFQNSTVVENTFAAPAYTFPASNEQIITQNIALNNGENVSQVRINFSFDASKWYIIPVQRFNIIKPSSSTYIQTYAGYDGSNLVITLRVIPIGAAPNEYPAFNYTVNAKIFITPSN